MNQHREPRIRALVKEFYANLGKQKNLTCYVRGEMDPSWGKGHLPALGAKTSGQVHRG